MGKMFLFYVVLSVFAINNVLTSNNGACEKGALSCDDGKQCVESKKWCDKKDDCEDKSDEAYCKTKSWYNWNPNECKDTQFLCSSGICIPNNAKCNDHDDCGDFSDEAGCEEESTTKKTVTTQTPKSVEVTPENDKDTSEETEESDEEEDNSFEKEDVEDEKLIANSDLTPSSVTAESTTAFSSSTQDYYRMRLNEVDPPKQDSSTQPSSSSTREHTTPSAGSVRTTSPNYPRQRQTVNPNYAPRRTTAIPDYRRQQPTAVPDYQRQRPTAIPDYRRQQSTAVPDYQHPTAFPDYRRHQSTAVPDYQRQRPTAIPDYRRQQSTAVPDYQRQRPTAIPDYRREHPNAIPDYQRQYQTANPNYRRRGQTSSHDYDRNGQTFVRRPPPHQSSPQTYYPQIHDLRPTVYDRRQQPYDNRRPEGYDSTSQIYGRHPHYDRNSHDRRQQQPYDSRASIFSTRNHRPSAVNNNVRNGESDWKEVASLKPYSGLTEISPQFHFAKNYANIYGRSAVRHVREGANWLMNQRNEDGDWGKDTARALVALALANNSFPSGNSDYEIMKRRFMVQLSVALLRNSSDELQLSRMAMSMNGLFAVCEDPGDFHALDLGELLRIRIRETSRKRGYPNPFVYLSLCLAGKPLTDTEVQNLMKKMTPSGSHEEISKDMQSLAIQAFTCHMQQVSSRDHAYRMSLQEKLNNAVSDLVSRMDEDGSFGSVYSTALAAQALISVNDTRGWSADKTINFLKQQQREDGSFGDLLATYYTLPVLSGRSLLHLRNIQCTPEPVERDLKPAEIMEFVGPKMFVHYSIYFGYPMVSSHSLRVLVPEGINFLDVMKVSEYQNKNFRFSYETGDKDVNIYSISGTPNDLEQGQSWHLYVKNDADPNQKELLTSEQYNGDVRDFFPTTNKHMIFWYHPVGLRI